MIRTLVALLLGAIFLLCSFVAAAQSPDMHGPSWSTIAGWLGAVVGTCMLGWAARLESQDAKAQQLIKELDEGQAKELRELRMHYDARVAEAMSRSADITLRLTEFKLEMTRALTSYPTKSEFERGIEKLADQFDRMSNRFDDFVRLRSPHG
jgi:hypothetical protein